MSISDQENKHLFQGKERDWETGLDYVEARYYDPAIGMFRQVDPHFDKYLTIDPFNYAFNNPMMIIDPTGMDGDSTNKSNTTQENTNNSEENEEYVLLGGKFKVNKKLYDHLVANGSWEPGENDILVNGNMKELNKDIVEIEENMSFKIEKYDFIHGSPLKTLKTYTTSTSLSSAVTIPLYAFGASGAVTSVATLIGGGIISQFQDAEKNNLSKYSNYDGLGYKIIITKKKADLFKTEIYTKELYFNSKSEFITSFQYSQINYIQP